MDEREPRERDVEELERQAMPNDEWNAAPGISIVRLDETFEPLGRESQAIREDDDVALRRTLQDAFIDHHAVTMWDGAEHAGTIVAATIDTVVLHIGRHAYVRYDVKHDLHGDAPSVGDRVSIRSDGSHQISAERPVERGPRSSMGR